MISLHLIKSQAIIALSTPIVKLSPIGKKAKAQWEKCAASQPVANTTQTQPTNEPKQPTSISKNTKIALIAGGSLLVITVITLIVLKRKKK